MKNGICPKCKATEVYHGFATEGEGLTSGSYTLLIELMTGKTQTTLWVDTYVCRACGYTELHVANPEDLAGLPLADGWDKVTPESA